MKAIFKTAFGILLLFTTSAQAQVLTVDSVLSRIDRWHPVLGMNMEKAQSAREMAKGAFSWMPPVVSAGPWQTPYSAPGSGMWMFSAQQMFPRKAKQTARFRYLDGMAEVSMEERAIQRNSLFAKAKDLYVEMVIMDMQLAILQKNDSLLSVLLKLARSRYAYNREALAGIYRVEATMVSWKNTATALQGEKDVKRAELNTLMGLPPGHRFEADPRIIFKPYETMVLDTSVLDTKRSDLRQMEAMIRQTERQKEVERNRRLPEAGISVSHMESFGMRPGAYSAMGMVTLPLVPWASREYKSGLNSIDHSAKALELEKLAIRNEVAGHLASLQIRLAAAKKQLEDYRQGVMPAYDKACESSLLAYRENTGDLDMVIEGLSMLNMTMMKETELLMEVLKLQTEYEKEMEIY